MSLLEISQLTAGYDRVPVLQGITIDVPRATTVAVVGPNGAGKTTLARSLSGFTRILEGTIRLDGDDITGLGQRQRTLRGIVQVPEGRRLFPALTVIENLEVAFLPRRKVLTTGRRQQLLTEAFEHFPVLADRRVQTAGTLSGGEQQMLAIARALLLEPRVLILDEPSTGLAPVIRHEIFTVLVSRVEATGCACLLIEQRARDALRIASYGYILERGRIAHQAPAADILADPELRRSYIGA